MTPPEPTITLSAAQDAIQRLDVYQMAGTFDGQEFSYVLVRRAQVHAVLRHLAGVEWTGLMAGFAPAETDRITTNSGDTGGPSLDNPQKGVSHGTD